MVLLLVLLALPGIGGSMVVWVVVGGWHKWCGWNIITAPTPKKTPKNSKPAVPINLVSSSSLTFHRSNTGIGTKHLPSPQHISSTAGFTPRRWAACMGWELGGGGGGGGGEACCWDCRFGPTLRCWLLSLNYSRVVRRYRRLLQPKAYSRDQLQRARFRVQIYDADHKPVNPKITNSESSIPTH